MQRMAKVKTPRWAWALTRSGHFFKECLRMLGELNDDLFVRPTATRLFRDTTASAAPVGLFYYGTYHTLILAPATSNTKTKCVVGISDTLVTNVFAQAGKCRLPAIVLACDTAPELATEAAKGMVKVYPREIDLENTERLKSFENTVVVESLEDRRTALGRRRRELHG
jgi:dihydromethanopterin reductase (acceptor)